MGRRIFFTSRTGKKSIGYQYTGILRTHCRDIDLKISFHLKKLAQATHGCAVYHLFVPPFSPRLAQYMPNQPMAYPGVASARTLATRITEAHNQEQISHRCTMSTQTTKIS